MFTEIVTCRSVFCTCVGERCKAGSLDVGHAGHGTVAISDLLSACELTEPYS